MHLLRRVVASVLAGICAVLATVTSAECLDYVRAAVNFRCQKWLGVEVGWVGVNCGAVGYTVLWAGGASYSTGYDFGSTGPDGTTSVTGNGSC